MQSDSWLSKNIRPLSLVFLMAVFVLITFFDGNVGEFSVNKEYIPVYSALLGTAFMFYFGSRGAEKIATRNDTPYLVTGLIDYLEGAVNPVVYLPSIPRSGGSGTDVQIINRYHDQILCTIDPETSIDNVLGDENLSIGGELFRVATLNMTEII